jgi:hypothetical protein
MMTMALLDHLIMQLSGGSSAFAPALTSDQVLVSVKDCLQDKMRTSKREISQEREVVDDRFVKRIRMEKCPAFRKKSHKLQFAIEFNASIMDKMEAWKQLQHCSGLHPQWRRPRQVSRRCDLILLNLGRSVQCNLL